MKKVIIYAILAALFVACSGKYSFTKPEFLEKKEILKIIQKDKYPESKDYPNDDACNVYYKVTEEIKVDNDNYVQYQTVYVVKKLFRNLVDNSKIKIYLDDKEELVYLEGRTINNDTIAYNLDEKDFSTIKLTSGLSKGEDKIINITFKNIQENSLIEYIYVVRNVNSIFGRSHILQTYKESYLYNNLDIIINDEIKYYQPTGWREYSGFYYSYRVWDYVEKPVSITYSINANGLTGNQRPDIKKVKDNAIFSWTFKDIPSFEIEDDMPPLNVFVPRIKFQPRLVENWEDIFGDYEAFLDWWRPDSTVTEVKEKTLELVKDEKDKVKQVQIISDFVRSIRYENNRFGDEGIIPLKPLEVIEKGYGDCKDKSFLLHTMLKYLDIYAHPVLVMTNDDGITNKDIPIWNFNHMIVKVEIDSVNQFWIDPTVSKCKLGEIPASIQGVGAIVLRIDKIKEPRRFKKSGFEYIPENNYNDNNILFKYDLMVKNTDSLYYNVQMACKGEFGLKLRNTKFDANDNDIKDIIKNYMDEEFKDVEILDLKYQNLENPDNPFIIEFKFNAGGKMKKLTKNMYSIDIDPFRSLRKTKWLNQNTKRKHPVYFDYQYSINKEANIILGDKVKFVESPAPGDISNDMTDYSRMLISDDDRKFEYRENFASKKIFILTEDTDKAKKLFTDIKSLQGNSLVVELE